MEDNIDMAAAEFESIFARDMADFEAYAKLGDSCEMGTMKYIPCSITVSPEKFIAALRLMARYEKARREQLAKAYEYSDAMYTAYKKNLFGLHSKEDLE